MYQLFFVKAFLKLLRQKNFESLVHNTILSFKFLSSDDIARICPGQVQVDIPAWQSTFLAHLTTGQSLRHAKFNPVLKGKLDFRFFLS